MSNLFTLFSVATITLAAHAQTFRPPAVPLITHDPYFSCWSFNDTLNADWPCHWTGQIHAMCGMIRIDDTTYSVIGNAPQGVEKMKQTSLEVLPTRTTYQFEGGGIALTLTFRTPALPDDLDLLSRPATYVVFGARSTDGRLHHARIYLDATGEWAVNKVDQQVVWGQEEWGSTTAVHIGSQQQPVLEKKGDNLRIDWGRLYLTTAQANGPKYAGNAHVAHNAFAENGALPEKSEPSQPRAASDHWPAVAAVIELARLGNTKTAATGYFLLAYDDEFSIEYMKQKLRPWWRRNGQQAREMIHAALNDYEKIETRCDEFDQRLMTDLTKAGGKKYARLCALAYRQCLAAHKLVASEDGKTPLLFSKENFSNGCIDTVDVTYPSAPFFLLLNPTLLKGQLTPILDYAAGNRWKFPFAPHDLGTYPKANGQVYGGGERTERNQMPVEESGNMLIMLGALAKIEGNADYANKYWPTLAKWAAYLKDKGLDPENQLCTDDFAGHLAHNTNLSLKAIVALAAYADLADRLGKKDEATTYRAEAQEMAKKWQSMAADGDHYRLTFDKPNTWSQKYNLVWDKLLGYNLFPKEVREKEIAFYKSKLNKYGLPLDNRKAYTKLDWILWTATMADNEADFVAILDPSYTWLNETPSRVPLTDWYDTITGKQSGFQARSVVGGLFIKMLADENTWKKYATR